MMELVEPAFLFFGLLISHGLGRYMSNRWHTKWDPYKVENAKEEAARANREAVIAKHEAESASRAWRRMTDELAQLRQALTAVTGEREAYKVIAESHEVKWPKVKVAEPEFQEIWGGGRRYQATFDLNFGRLERDLEELAGREGDKRVMVELDIYPRGWWWNHFKDTYGAKSWGIDGEIGRHFHYKAIGRPDEIVGDLRGLVKSAEKRRNNPLWVTKSSGNWRAPEDPVIFIVRTAVWREPVPVVKPSIHFVEVLKTETKVVEVERIVEREVEVSATKLDSELLAAVLEVETLGKKAIAARGAKSETR